MGSLVNSWISLIFILFAMVQINDDDYFIWIPIYLVPALLNTAFLFVDDLTSPRISPKLYWFVKILMFLHFQVCVVMSIYLVWNSNWFKTDNSDSAEAQARREKGKENLEFVDLLTNPAFEVERELGGLWICLFWVHRFWPPSRPNPSRHQFSKKKT